MGRVLRSHREPIDAANFAAKRNHAAEFRNYRARFLPRRTAGFAIDSESSAAGDLQDGRRDSSTRALSKRGDARASASQGYDDFNDVHQLARRASIPLAEYQCAA